MAAGFHAAQQERHADERQGRDNEERHERQRGEELPEQDRPGSQQRHLQRHQRLALAFSGDPAGGQTRNDEADEKEHDEQQRLERRPSE
jgi:hypothetical protein